MAEEEERIERIENNLFVSDRDTKVAVLRDLGFKTGEEKEIDQINFCEKIEEKTQVDKMIGGIKIQRKSAIKLENAITNTMKKMGFKVYEDNKKRKCIEFCIEENLAIYLSMVFGNASPEFYRLIDFKKDLFSFSGFTCFSRKNNVDKQPTPGDVHIIIAGNVNINARNFEENAFSAINNTFLFDRRLVMYKFHQLCAEFPPGYGETLNPFDEDNQIAFSAQNSWSERDKIPNIP